MEKKKAFSRKLLYVFLILVLAISICSCANDDVVSDTKENPNNASQSVPESETITDEDTTVNSETVEVVAPELEAIVAPVAVVTPTETYVEDTPITSQVETLVYITNTGEKYHSAGCQYLRKSEIPISLADARGSYSPCSKCNPPL